MRSWVVALVVGAMLMVVPAASAECPAQPKHCYELVDVLSKQVVNVDGVQASMGLYTVREGATPQSSDFNPGVTGGIVIHLESTGDIDDAPATVPVKITFSSPDVRFDGATMVELVFDRAGEDVFAAVPFEVTEHGVVVSYTATFHEGAAQEQKTGTLVGTGVDLVAPAPELAEDHGWKLLVVAGALLAYAAVTLWLAARARP